MLGWEAHVARVIESRHGVLDSLCNVEQIHDFPCVNYTAYILLLSGFLNCSSDAPSIKGTLKSLLYVMMRWCNNFPWQTPLFTHPTWPLRQGWRLRLLMDMDIICHTSAFTHRHNLPGHSTKSHDISQNTWMPFKQFASPLVLDRLMVLDSCIKPLSSISRPRNQMV